MLKFTTGFFTGFVVFVYFDAWCRKYNFKNSPAVKDNPNMQALVDNYMRTGKLDVNSPEFLEEVARFEAQRHLNNH